MLKWPFSLSTDSQNHKTELLFYVKLHYYFWKGNTTVWKTDKYVPDATGFLVAKQL